MRQHLNSCNRRRCQVAYFDLGQTLNSAPRCRKAWRKSGLKYLFLLGITVQLAETTTQLAELDLQLKTRPGDPWAGYDAICGTSPILNVHVAIFTLKHRKTLVMLRLRRHGWYAVPYESLIHDPNSRLYY